MRKQHPKNMERRVKSGFLLFPKTIKHETRWLEHASWEEMFVQHFPWRIHGEWKLIRWLT